MRVLLAAVAWWGIGCAGGAANVPTTPFRPSDAELFDNSVDLVAEPAIVGGEWVDEFKRRVARADLIASVRIETLSSERLQRRSAYRLDVKARDRIKGSSTKNLVLRVSDQQRGYESVEVNEDRLLHDAFIVFVKWETAAAESPPIPHWHLSPDSKGVRDKIDYALQWSAADPHTDPQAVGP